jgi:hypothetical protein
MGQTASGCKLSGEAGATAAALDRRQNLIQFSTAVVTLPFFSFLALNLLFQDLQISIRVPLFVRRLFYPFSSFRAPLPLAALNARRPL